MRSTVPLRAVQPASFLTLVCDEQFFCLEGICAIACLSCCMVFRSLYEALSVSHCLVSGWSRNVIFYDARASESAFLVGSECFQEARSSAPPSDFGKWGVDNAHTLWTFVKKADSPPNAVAWKHEVIGLKSALLVFQYPIYSLHCKS